MREGEGEVEKVGQWDGMGRRVGKRGKRVGVGVPASLAPHDGRDKGGLGAEGGEGGAGGVRSVASGEAESGGAEPNETATTEEAAQLCLRGARGGG